ncbi:hypothetical protein [Robbsia andropogonis]|uniref:hypothetical protein n=1 Tax=Robbsia andropogonis TaxID=28092 RepID=UPI0004655798|nr:hypothetical protein [Robbsia andropogonis]
MTVVARPTLADAVRHLMTAGSTVRNVTPGLAGFDLLALPRARRLAAARRRHLIEWLAAALSALLLLLALEAIGAWRVRIAAQDQRDHRVRLLARVRAVAPVWRDAMGLTAMLEREAARQHVLAGFDGPRWALHDLLDALSRAGTPALALQRLHFHMAGQPRWPADVTRDGAAAMHEAPRQADEAPVRLTDVATTEEGLASDTAGWMHVIDDTVPGTAAFALGAQGIADDDAALRAWMARLQRDPRVGAVTIDAWRLGASRLSAPAARASALVRFRVNVFARGATAVPQ